MLDAESQVLSLEDLIATVKGRINNQYRTRVELEDLIQEAAIYTWKKWEEGASDLDCYYAGTYRARQLVYSFDYKPGKTEYMGTPLKNLDNRQEAQGEKTREKIRGFITEYRKLHGKTPNPSNISEGVGIARTTVRHHLDRLYLFAAEVENPYFVNVDDAFLHSEDEPPPVWITDMPVTDMGEEDILLQLGITEAMKDLSDREKKFLYLSYWEDLTDVEVGKQLGCTGPYIYRIRLRVFDKLREKLKDLNDEA